MNYVIALFGTAVALGGATLLARPGALFGLFRRHIDSLGLHVFAVAVRLVFGAAMIAGAPQTRHPAAVQIIGWVMVVGALALAVIGRGRFKALIRWALTFSPNAQRAMAAAAIALGAYLIYAAL